MIRMNRLYFLKPDCCTQDLCACMYVCRETECESVCVCVRACVCVCESAGRVTTGEDVEVVSVICKWFLKQIL